MGAIQGPFRRVEIGRGQKTRLQALTWRCSQDCVQISPLTAKLEFYFPTGQLRPLRLVELLAAIALTAKARRP